MSIDEASRLHLYEQARNAWGGAAADTLMNAIPHDPDRFATKDDLAVLGAELRAEIAGVRTEIADLRGEMKHGHGELLRSQGELLRTLFFAMVASNATLVGLVFAAVRLA